MVNREDWDSVGPQGPGLEQNLGWVWFPLISPGWGNLSFERDFHGLEREGGNGGFPFLVKRPKGLLNVKLPVPS